MNGLYFCVIGTEGRNLKNKKHNLTCTQWNNHFCNRQYRLATIVLFVPTYVSYLHSDHQYIVNLAGLTFPQVEIFFDDAVLFIHVAVVDIVENILQTVHF